MTTIVVRTRMKRDEVRRLLATVPAIVSGRAADPSGEEGSVQKLIGMTALSLIKEAFVTKAAGGVDAAGDSWPALADSTVKGRRKGKGVGTPQILRDTGILLNSLSPGGIGNIVEWRPGTVTIGTNVPYARYHHEGTETIPARRLWPEPYKWPREWWDEIQEQARDAIARIIVRILGGST